MTAIFTKYTPPNEHFKAGLLATSGNGTNTAYIQPDCDLPEQPEHLKVARELIGKMGFKEKKAPVCAQIKNGYVFIFDTKDKE